MLLRKLVITLFILSFVFAQRQHSEFHSVLNLKSFQADNGGFRIRRGQPVSLDATYHALLLSSIYGLQDKFNTTEALRYIQKLENSDGGYGKEVGENSDLESTRYALLGLRHLSQSIPNPSSVSGFLQKFYDKDAHLFTLRSGEKPSLKATLYAVNSFQLINDDKFIKAQSASILEELKKSIKDETFISKESGSPSTINFYGISLASKLEYSFQNIDAWAKKIVGRQLEDGGFGSPEATYHAIASVYILQSKAQGKNYFSDLNKQKLTEYLHATATDLRSSALNHLSHLLLNGLEAFAFSVNYESSPLGGVVENRIIQGSKVRPVVSIRSVGHPVSSLKVTLLTTFGNDKPKIETLSYRPESQNYRAQDLFDSTDKLGPTSFLYTISWNLPEVGPVQFSHKDEGTVGYGITVASDAKLAGKDIEPGLAVGVGTTFNFKATLNTQSQPNIINGDFTFIFSILDSSDLTVHETTIDGKSNKEPFSFAYELKTADLPAGQIVFLFQVKNQNGIHTTKKISYTLAIPMIATEIQLSQNKYKLGDKVEASMSPANFPDLRNVVPLSGKDGAKRQFFMIISTPLGTRLQTLLGTPRSVNGKLVYTFSFTIPNTFDHIGKNIISFQYKPVHGNEVDLLPYDSKISELYDDTTALNFEVQAELFMHNVKEQISKDIFFYGHEITFKFQVKDALSNNIVLAGNHELANVFLSLNHQFKARTITSMNQTATHYLNSNGEVEGFLIQWMISPNAIGGKGFLSISAADPDGNRIKIFRNQSRKEEATFKVNISGTIESKHKIFVNSEDDEKAIFSVEFNLFCQGNPLKNAQLRSNVYYRPSASEEKHKLFELPVAVNDKTGGYEVSWFFTQNKALSGEYIVEFFREVDRSMKSDEASQPLVEIIIPYQAPSKPCPSDSSLLLFSF